ncbi:MAG: DUF368 domain-containing protein [Bacilli bacterium]
MKKIIEIFKGMMIGIANVIPGLSGGSIAVAFNIYDKFIYGFSNFFKHPIKTIKLLWAIVLGMGIGIAVSVVGVIYFLENFPVPTTMLFVGMVIGSLPFIKKKMDKEEKTKYDLSVFISMIVLMLGVMLMHIFFGENMVDITTINLKIVIIILILGIVSAATMIVPGISGSMMLMVLGYYYYITSLSDGIVRAVLNLDFIGMWDFVWPMVPFVLGNVIGVVFMAKLLEKALIKYPRQLYCAILGLLISSPILIFYSMYKDYPTAVMSSLEGAGIILTVGIGFVLMVLGALFVNYMSKFEEKENESKAEEPKENKTEEDKPTKLSSEEELSKNSN